MLLKRIKKIMLGIIISAMLLSISTVNKSYAQESIVLGLDYGHNTTETYKSDPNGRLEIEYAYEIGKKVKSNIEAARPDIKIYETNPDKTNRLRAGRSEQCKDNGVDFLVSLHMDSIGKEFNDKYKGTHVIVDKDSRENVTQYIAKKFIKGYSEDTGIPMRLNNGFDNTRNNIGILDKAEELHIPAMLLEMGMYSNHEEYEIFNNKQQIDIIAKSISDGILENVITYLDKVNSEEINEQNQFIKLKVGENNKLN